jgi:hypothetical protein
MLPRRAAQFKTTRSRYSNAAFSISVINDHLAAISRFHFDAATGATLRCIARIDAHAAPSSRPISGPDNHIAAVRARRAARTHGDRTRVAFGSISSVETKGTTDFRGFTRRRLDVA